MDSNAVYKMVTDRVLEMINKGIIPWNKPWSFSGKSEDEQAINYVTRKPYSLINQWLLMEPGEYLTFKQVVAAHGKIRKGAKARFVVFFTHVPIEKKDERTGETEIATYPFLRYYNVFHIKDTEGIASKIEATVPDAPVADLPVCAEADAAIDAYVASQNGLRFINDKESDRAYYSPAEDKVVVPMRSQFNEMAEYYSTAFHELTHSTLIESRCNRRTAGAVAFYGSREYSREELVAEMGAAMLCSNFKVDTEKAFRNSVGYLQGWAGKLKNDPRAIVVAAGKAEKAVRYILGERGN